MSEFKKNIEEYHDVSLDNIKCAAVNALPAQYRHKPWCITNKGGSDVDNTYRGTSIECLPSFLYRLAQGKIRKSFCSIE